MVIKVLDEHIDTLGMELLGVVVHSLDGRDQLLVLLLKAPRGPVILK